MITDFATLSSLMSELTCRHHLSGLPPGEFGKRSPSFRPKSWLKLCLGTAR